eukprot:Hpha_TRINITY_DN3760_c0_g1::TRINITY_DN3760_c0_g1_i1::g.23867::m.23867
MAAVEMERPKLKSWTDMTREQERLQKMIEASAESSGAPPKLAQCLSKTAPILAWSATGLHCMFPLFRFCIYTGYSVYSKLPKNCVLVIAGSTLCLFGGTFPTLIAAVEAARHNGWPDTRRAVLDLWQESERMVHVLEEDDKVDADHDGTPDVDQMSGKQLLLHKLHVFLENADAQKINTALSGLATSFAAVTAVLKIEFARTIALAQSISTMMHKPATFLIAPVLHHLSRLHDGQPHYQQWTPLVIDYTCKITGMMIAWKIQQVLSAFHSAARGGLMVSQGLMRLIARSAGLPSTAEAAAAAKDIGYRWLWDPDSSYIDELVGYTLAAGGFYYQLHMNFALPFPFNLVLLPLRILESQLQYYITYGGNAQVAAA